MAKDKSKLDPQQRQAVGLALEGRTFREIAEAVGVDPATVFRWGALPAFVAAVNQERLVSWEAQQRRLHNLGRLALDRLEEELENGDPDGKLAMAVLRITTKLPVPSTAVTVERVEKERARAEILDELWM